MQRNMEAGPSRPRIPLPPGHFLSLPPSYADANDEFPSGVPSTSSHTSNGLAPNVASLAAADFEVDVRTGFLPGTNNVTRLPDAYALWEDALSAARGGGVPGQEIRLGGRREQDRLWRNGIETMPVLDTRPLLSSLPHLRRAHLVLSFLLHFYVHTTPAGPKTAPLPIPESISIPVVAVSQLLGLPPVVTYSDTVLYNFLPRDLSAPLTLENNPPAGAVETFTNTRSEEQFYIISAMCEIAGAEALKLMRQSLDELFLSDSTALRRLTLYLRRLATKIDLIGDITLSMLKEIDPEEFYHLIRPWFRGGDSDGPSSLGWEFKGTNASGSTAENPEISTTGSLFSGPSAGQSSLIHAIDIFLTVDHSEQIHEASPKILVDDAPIAQDAKSTPNEATFVERMLQYMPHQHRTFLLHLASHPAPLRQLVVQHQHTHPKLAQAYDGALEALKRFREKHMRIVSFFIIQQARRQPSERIREMTGMDGFIEVPKGDELRGTGGSPLFKFLKRCRDNTTKAMLGKPAGPGYELEQL